MANLPDFLEFSLAHHFLWIFPEETWRLSQIAKNACSLVQHAQTKEVVNLELATTNESSAYSQRQSMIDPSLPLLSPRRPESMIGQLAVS